MPEKSAGLTAETVASYRLQLLKRQRGLLDLQGSGHEASQTVALDQTRVGRLSRMDALQGQAMSKEGERRRAMELQRIHAALARIDSGEFGCCLACGEAIAGPRLDFDPSTPLCIDCAAKVDAGAG